MSQISGTGGVEQEATTVEQEATTVEQEAITHDETRLLPIKCLSITGGGHNGFSSIAILKESFGTFWDYDSIESIYSTSSGSIIAVIIALKLKMEDIIQYALERPLDTLVSFDSSRLFALVNENGMYGKEMFVDFLKPLFASVDIELDISLKDFYEISKIELIFFASEVTSFESVKISYKTFPELSVIDAISMSASIPIIFKPICIDNKYYFDGGFFKASPYPDALLSYKSTEILCICERYYFDKTFDNSRIQETTISNFFMILISRTMRRFNLEYEKNFTETPTTFIMESTHITPTALYKCKEQLYRKELYDYGVTIYNNKLLTQCSQNETLQ